jgi:CBS domain-containing protein
LTKVSEVMTRGIDPVDPGASVQEAAVQMAELDVGAVLVGTSDGLEGVLTDRDIIVRVVVEGTDPAAVQVRDVMSPTIFSCQEEDTVESAFAEMRERQVRRLPVLGQDGKPVGIVTMSDLAKVVESPERMQEALRELSEPHRNRKQPEEGEEEAPASAVVAESPPATKAGDA